MKIPFFLNGAPLQVSGKDLFVFVERNDKFVWQCGRICSSLWGEMTNSFGNVYTLDDFNYDRVGDCISICSVYTFWIGGGNYGVVLFLKKIVKRFMMRLLRGVFYILREAF